MESQPQEGLRKAEYMKISDLNPNAKGINLVAKVVQMEVVIQRPRVDGSVSRIAEATLADNTGCVVLRARNEQIDKLSQGEGEVGVVVRNATVEIFKGYMRLVVNKWGKISLHPDGIESTPPLPETLNTENNLSSVEYELVDVPNSQSNSKVTEDTGGADDQEVEVEEDDA
mmetsp:Transcript_33236/g.43800  ORF Transcript_33236/g.43800 Transcript_33236/m.43800 type:complete len:171 (-) Transcript_33236:233-745(-)